VGDVTGLLDTLGVESAHVVGHDWGAAVAWVMAVSHPDRVQKLVVVSVGGRTGIEVSPRICT
jgi:pimeloyl-ACP methyl ester carboxylesterase